MTQTLHDIKDELKEFLSTRAQLFFSEMQQKLTHYKMAAPFLIGGAVVGIVAFLVFSFGLVALIAESLTSPYAWTIAAACIFVFYGLVAGVLAWVGIKEISNQTVMPERTVRVLRDDQQALRNEMRVA